MKAIRVGAVVFVAMALFGCATSFVGEANVENGRAGCEAKCKAQGMDLAGMVYMGEYSDACVCEVPGKTAASSRRDMLVGAAGSGGGAAGVWMQMQAAKEREQNQMTFHPIH
jgi:hypothetical protein